MKESEPTIKQNSELKAKTRPTGLTRVYGAYKGPDEYTGEYIDEAKEIEMDFWGRLKNPTLEFGGIPLEQFEIEKTKEEVQIIRKMIGFMHKFVRRYGGVPVDLTPDCVRFFDLDKMDSDTKEKIVKRLGVDKAGNNFGNYSSRDQVIEIFINSKSDYELKRFNIFQIVAHELLHFNSVLTIQVLNFEPEGELTQEEKKQTRFFLKKKGIEVADIDSPFTLQIIRRSGLGVEPIENPGETYFSEVDEAITAELEKKFCEEFFPKIPGLYGEVRKKADIIRERLKKNKNSTKDQETDKFYSYVAKRKNLQNIIDEILKTNKFGPREKIFEIFARASMTESGFLAFAKMIERSFGKKSLRGNRNFFKDLISEETGFARAYGAVTKINEPTEEEPSEGEFKETAVNKFNARNSRDLKKLKEASQRLFQESAMTSNVDLPKTIEQQKILQVVFDKMPKFVRHLNGTPARLVPSQIHVCDIEKMDSMNRKLIEKMGRSYYNDKRQLLAIFSPADLTFFARRLIYEVLRLNSYQEWSWNNPKNNIEVVYSGLQMYSSDGNWVYLRGLNNAVAKELALKFEKEFFPNLWRAEDEIEEEVFDPNKKDREQLQAMLSDIFNAHNGQLTRVEIFNMFAEAMMSGQISDLATLVDKTYGKGYFQNFAETTKERVEF